MKLNIIGNIFSTSGFASHARQLANALHELGHEIRIDSMKPQCWEMLVTDTELLMLQRLLDRDYISIFIGQPQFLPLVRNNEKTIIPFVIWEGNRVPKFWLETLLKDDIPLIFVPSEHVKQAILFYPEAKKIKEKIKIIPHGVNTVLFQSAEKEKETFRFIMCKGWNQGMNDRGGIQYGLLAYINEFNKNDKVEMLVKINTAYNNPNWNFQDEMKKIGIEKSENNPLLKVSVDSVDFKQMPNFYNEGDVFVSPAMAEAFNLPCLEAMSCGLPVITTNYGGQTDYVNKKNGWLIKGKFIDVTWDMQYEGIKWYKPDLQQLQKIMREAYEKRELVRKKSVEALKTAQQFTWRKSAEKITEEIKFQFRAKERGD